MLDFSRFNSLISVINHFSIIDNCKSFLAEQRWGDGKAICPYCGKSHTYKRKDGRYICHECNKSFSVTQGTMFHNSNIKLNKWFIAMYIVSSHKKGISSHQLSRDIEVTQKTAWYMLQKIRTLYKQDAATLEGCVEMDEMYLGGKERWKHSDKKTPNAQGRSLKAKTPIFGMIQREGNAVILKVKDTTSKTLMPLIKKYVEKNAHLFTDEGLMYKPLSKEGFEHQNCDHASGQYVSEEGASTNCVEGFWSHFRRCIYGIYHQCSVKYLQRYIDEQTFRWNSRKWTEGQRFADMLGKSARIVSYKTVVNYGMLVVRPWSKDEYNKVMRGYIKWMMEH